MSNKLPLPARFSDDAMSYSLVYIPGLPADTDPRYSVEPNVTSMRPIGRNVQSVNITGKGKMIFTWVLMEQPAKPGTTTPARQYLFFRLSDKPIPLDLLKPGDMICYAATPKHVTTDPAQCFVDSLFGQVSADAQAERPRDTRASQRTGKPSGGRGMSEETTVDRVFRRIEQDVERILDREPSSRGVLNQVIQEGAPMFMAYKMRGRVPSVDALERVATKLLAIVVATEEARR